MAASTYKCPSCGGYLAFDPETQKWKCPFCDSIFDESVILPKEEAADEQPSEAQVTYRCQSCGSEIMTDATTVATNCYYCHSPVVLQGKLTSGMRPDSVVPFQIDKEQAVQGFMNWVRSKKYVPQAFFNQTQVESMTGVYYPHFVSDVEVEGEVEGEGRNISVTDTAKYTTTRTDHYRVKREANITFRSIMRPALSKVNRKLSDGIHPFPLQDAKPFSDAYLTGFLAERRDIAKSEIQNELAREAAGYVESLLRDTIHYDSTSLTPASKVKKIETRYTLLPTWVLTYPNKQNKDDPYYYAMNGCTGEVCGKLPIDRKKLYLTALGAGAVVFAIACILCYFVF